MKCPTVNQKHICIEVSECVKLLKGEVKALEREARIAKLSYHLTVSNCRL